MFSTQGTRQRELYVAADTNDRFRVAQEESVRVDRLSENMGAKPVFDRGH